MTTDADQLESKIKNVMHAVGETCKVHDGSTTWTSNVKRLLWDLGRSEGYVTCGTGCDYGEWLFDLCWYRGPDECFTSFVLAVESEWKNQRASMDQYDHDIRFDFQKLLVARVDHRMMIFEQNNREDFLQVVRNLTKCVSAFEGTASGDRYLFAGWLWEPQEFAFESYVVG